MTKYNELDISADKKINRVGRGISAGQGKTAGRGTKGQKARSGKKLRPSFAGGSRTLVTAIPKGKGFKSLRTPAQVVFLDELDGFKGKLVDNFALYEAGLINTPYHAVKIILRGNLNDKVDVKVQAASKNVKQAIKDKGGTFEAIPTPLKVSEKVDTKAASKDAKK